MKTAVFFMAVILSSGYYAQSLKEAIYKTENERYAEALNDFKSLVKNEPSNGDAYFYYGDCYFEKGEIDSAIMIWNKGYDMDKLTPMPFVGKFRVLWLKGDKVAAQIEFDRAMALTKKNKVKRAEVNRGIAEIYIESDNKNLDQALILLTEAIEKDAKNEDNLLLQGDALYAKTPQDASLAIKSYNQVITINPKSPRGKVRIANIYQAAQNFEEANKIYKEAKALDSTFAPAYRESAELYMRFDKMKLAIQDWKKYLALNNNVESRYRYANAMYASKQYCEVITEVLYLNEENIRNYFTERMLAGSYLGCASQTEGAQNGLDASDRFFKIAPQDKVTFLDYKTRGELLMKLGQDSLAIVSMEIAANMNDAAAKELTDDIAKMYKKQKRYDKAIETYAKRKSMMELTLAELYDFAQCYYAGPKNYKEADTLFAQVAQISPNYAPSFWWRGRCNSALDPNYDKWLALPYYLKVIEVVKPEERTKDSNKKMILESSKYCGNYYSKSQDKDADKSKYYFEIVLSIDPNDSEAKKALGIK